MENDERLVFLVEKLKELDNSYFDEFYELTKKLVYYICYSIVKRHADAEDLLQETYLDFLKHIKRVNTNKPIIAYILRIARNKSLNFIKKHKRIEISENLDIVDNTQIEKIEDSELVETMKKILNTNEFEVVIMHVVLEMKHREIALVLKKPLGTITYIYKCAIDKLRREIIK